MKKTKDWSIKAKILLPLIAGISVVGLSLFIYFMSATYSMQKNNVDSLMQTTTSLLKSSIEQSIIAGKVDDINGVVNWFIQQPNIESIEIEFNGNIVLFKSKNLNTPSRYKHKITENIIAKPSLKLPNQPNSVNDTHNNKEVTGAFTVTYSNKNVIDAFMSKAILTSLVFVLFLLAIIFISVFSLKRTNQLFNKILAAIQQYKQGNLNARIETNQHNFLGQDLGQIAAQFNNMANTLQEKENKLLESKALQSRFMSTMSHDLRSPLGIIISSMQLITERDDLSGSAKLNLKAAMMASKQLLKLIDDVISINMISKKGEQLSLSDTDIIAVLQGAIDTLQPNADDKGLHLGYANPGIESLYVYADENKIIRIFNNLVSNAIKFTLYGSVNVSLAFIHKDDDNVEMALSIKDSGVGIAEEQLKDIFKPFKKIKNKNTATVQGSGLGLSIVAEYIALMGGEIKVRSKVGLGTVFIVSIPFEKSTKLFKSSANTDMSSLQSTPSPKKILFVEDNEQYQKIVKNYLDEHDVTVCTNGADALIAFKNETFDLVILDCKMQPMDGFEVAKHMREFEQSTHAKRTKITALTANAVPNTYEKINNSGMDFFMSKPFTRDELVNKVNNVLIHKSPHESKQRIKR